MSFMALPNMKVLRLHDEGMKEKIEWEQNNKILIITTAWMDLEINIDSLQSFSKQLLNYSDSKMMPKNSFSSINLYFHSFLKWTRFRIL